MRVLLCGGSGFVGGRIRAVLRRAGHEVVEAGRRPGMVPADFREDTDPARWAERLGGFDAVINAVGIIREADGNTFRALHGDTPSALFRGAAAAGARCVVQISALGTAPGRPEPYFAWRHQADEVLLTLPVRGVILRPSMVYGDGDHSMRMFRGMAAGPIVPLVGDGSSRLQPVAVDEVAAAVLRAVEDDGVRGIYELAGPTALSLREVYTIARASLGLGPPRFVPVPLGLLRLVARGTDRLGVGPITSDELSMLLAGNTSDRADLVDAFGIHPLPLAEGLAAADPATVLEAKLTPLRPVLRYALAFVWVATGVVCLWGNTPEARYGMLHKSGISGPLVDSALDVLCFAELPLGLWIATGWKLRWSGALQLLLIGSFSVFLLFTQPEAWLHVYGPLTKNLPLMAAIAVWMVLG